MNLADILPDLSVTTLTGAPKIPQSSFLTMASRHGQDSAKTHQSQSRTTSCQCQSTQDEAEARQAVAVTLRQLRQRENAKPSKISSGSGRSQHGQLMKCSLNLGEFFHAQIFSRAAREMTVTTNSYEKSLMDCKDLILPLVCW